MCNSILGHCIVFMGCDYPFGVGSHCSFFESASLEALCLLRDGDGPCVRQISRDTPPFRTPAPHAPLICP